MQKQHFSISINAPKEKVWNTIIGADTYPQWTAVFSEGSHAIGDWSVGSKMLFLAGTEEGSEGMVAVIAESRPYDFLSIKHLGYIKGGVEDTSSPEILAWAPAFENYTLTEVAAVTEFAAELDTAEEWLAMFADMWPKAMLKLKELCEA